MTDLADVLYPLMIICGLFAAIFVVGVIFGYLWLRYLEAQATRCPQCQARGAGEVVESNVVRSKAYVDTNRRRPMRIHEKVYEDLYACTQCGHRWLRTAVETHEQPVT